MGNPHNQIWTYLNAIWPIAIVLRHTLKYHTGLVFRIQWYYPTFFPHLQHSKFLTSYFLMFNPSHATYELLPSAGIRSYIPSFYFLKRVKSKFAMIHSCLEKKSLTFWDIGPFLPNALLLVYENFASPHSQRVLTTLQTLSPWLSRSIFSCQVTSTLSIGTIFEWLHSIRTLYQFPA